MRMQKLVEGVHSFQKGFFARHRELFEDLAQRGQRPHTLFITCSDSRILPNHLTGSGPGEMFIVRNVGNVVPRSDLIGGTASAIEYGVEVLGVNHIIVCGHVGCGAIDAVMDPKRVENLPYVKLWLKQTERVKELIALRYADLPPAEQKMAAVQENVLLQLENIREYDFVRRRLEANEIALSGWVLDVETGKVFDFDPESGEFIPLVPPSSPALP